MTWPKMLALSLVLVACTEQLVEAITGRGDPTSNGAPQTDQARPQRSERQRRPERPPTITAHGATPSERQHEHRPADHPPVHLRPADPGAISAVTGTRTPIDPTRSSAATSASRRPPTEGTHHRPSDRCSATDDGTRHVSPTTSPPASSQTSTGGRGRDRHDHRPHAMATTCWWPRGTASADRPDEGAPDREGLHRRHGTVPVDTTSTARGRPAHMPDQLFDADPYPPNPTRRGWTLPTSTPALTAETSMTFDPTARWTPGARRKLPRSVRLPTSSAAAVICDPPYSSGGFTRGDRMGAAVAKYVLTSTQLENRTSPATTATNNGYLRRCTVWLDECLRVTRARWLPAMFTDWRQLAVTTDAVQAGGWVWRDRALGQGRGPRPRRGGFRSQAEYVVWATATARRGDHDVYLAGFLHVTDDGPQPAGCTLRSTRPTTKHHRQARRR